MNRNLFILPEVTSPNGTTLLPCERKKNYENYLAESITGLHKMVGLILLQNSHIVLHQIAYQFLLNKVHINQKRSQILSSMQSNLHFIPEATMTNLFGLMESNTLPDF